LNVVQAVGLLAFTGPQANRLHPLFDRAKAGFPFVPGAGVNSSRLLPACAPESIGRIKATGIFSSVSNPNGATHP
jgi:hypothetical protein